MSEDLNTTEHPMDAMSYVDAITHTEQWLNSVHLRGEDAARGFTWKIYDYYDRDEQGLAERPWVGVRVSEVSIASPAGGASYMQVDQPWGIAICAQVERCILALVEGWNRDAEYVPEDGGYMPLADTDEEFWRLSGLLEEAGHEGAA